MLGIAILAAGKGKRMNSTDTPKVLVQLLGKPLLGYVLDTAINISPHKIYVIVGFQKNKVIDFVQNNYSQGKSNLLNRENNLALDTQFCKLSLISTKVLMIC